MTKKSQFAKAGLGREAFYESRELNTDSTEDGTDEKVLKAITASETEITADFDALVGSPDTYQQKILKDLVRLQYSLRGPEEALDQGNYSRPIPAPLRANFKKSVNPL